MNRLSALLMIGTCLIVCGAASGPHKRVYEIGKLVDVRSNSTGAGALRGQRTFCLAIQVQDISYIVLYAPLWRNDYEPTKLIVGDPVDVRIKEDDLFLRTGNKFTNDLTHKQHEEETKMKIVRRERITSDKKPSTCGLPVELHD
jgi:hypothetical protein